MIRRLATILALAALFAAGTALAAPNAVNQARLDSTIRYLQEAQREDGGFAEGGEPSQTTSAWSALALGAAGINPRDQARPGGVDVYSYLEANFWDGVGDSECDPIPCTTTLEREAMVANVAGASPRNFGGFDLIAALLSRVRPDGSFPHVPGGVAGVNDTIFAIFAFAPTAEARAASIISEAADWIESRQLASGGWHYNVDSPIAEVDMTGAAIQALVVAGRGNSTAVDDGLSYLREAQNPDGGFPFAPGAESNVASTAWAVQAIWAVGDNPEEWRTESGLETEEPLDLLASLQEPSGRIRWMPSADLNGIWMTAQVAPAFAGQSWPFPEVGRRLALKEDPPLPGEGEGTQSATGVISGGGGEGAPLFSRPKQQSRGRTPGGARVVGNDDLRPEDHSPTRRGENAVQPQGTEQTESRSVGEPARVSSEAGEGVGGAGGEDPAASGTPGAGDSGSGATGSLRLPAPEAVAPAGGEGERVTGFLVGESGEVLDGAVAFGAPGPHGAGESDPGIWLALAVGAGAAAMALGGAGWERRRGEVAP